MESEDVLGPATAVEDIKILSPVAVFRDAAGQMFIRNLTDDDILRTLP